MSYSNFKSNLFAFFHTFQRVTDTFCTAPKVIWALLANFRMVIEYRVQFDWICMRCSITLYQYAKRAQITCGAVSKNVIGYPLDAFACGNRELHASPRMSAIYRWENLKRRQVNFYHPRFLYISRPIQPYHFQADLNWCDGTFKARIGDDCQHLIHCTENLIYVFPEVKLCGLVLNSYIRVSVIDL
jgi:hypothetical protein